MSATVPLGTKGRSLQHLTSRLRSAEVLPLALVDHASWHTDRNATLDALLDHPWLPGAPLIVRSSAATEASVTASEAGHYLTLPRVPGDLTELAAAIDEVFASYDDAQPADEVLIQPELADVASAGVATTHDPTTGAPYVVISWAERDTSVVTSGRAGDVRVWYGAAYTELGARGPEPVPHVLALLAELREVTGEPRLAVEWAVAASGALVLLQVRPLALKDHEVMSVSTHRTLLTRVQDTLRTAQAAHDPRPTAYGVMPFWNPAELIGLLPRPLARSLFEYLIAASAWSAALAPYGYSDPARPLLLDLGGRPYVDVRASMSSLVPRDLPDAVASRLVDAWVAHLLAAPYLHDKIESKVVVSSIGLRTPSRLDRLADIGVAHSDIHRLRDALRRLTSNMIARRLWLDDLRRAGRLRDVTPTSTNPRGLLDRLRSCREYGTRPFAALARCAFVATEFLDDLVAEDVLSPDERAAFIAGLDLVSGQLQRDFHQLPPDQLLSLYGHLRPGTWDICAPRYDEDPARYFNWPRATPHAPQAPPPPFRPIPAQLTRISHLLRHSGLTVTPRRLLAFVAATVRGRERAKFLFSATLSDVLRDLRTLGHAYDFTPDDMSYLDIRVLPLLTSDPRHDASVLASAIQAGRTTYASTRGVELPPLLSRRADVWAFPMPAFQPTFVTRERVRARLARIDAGEPPDGAVALVDAADPGYDWIFTRGIAGLVTAWGGVNSHMAVRAIELGIPAAIGVGPERFRALSHATTVDLDAGARTLVVVQ